MSTQAGASTAIATLDAAINTVSGQRAHLGAVQNRLQHTSNSLSVAAENASAAESRIRDTDMAKEMTSFTRSQILQQAGVSMLAQANQAPQSVLKPRLIERLDLIVHGAGPPGPPRGRPPARTKDQEGDRHGCHRRPHLRPEHHADHQPADAGGALPEQQLVNHKTASQTLVSSIRA